MGMIFMLVEMAHDYGYFTYCHTSGAVEVPDDHPIKSVLPDRLWFVPSNLVVDAIANGETWALNEAMDIVAEETTKAVIGL